MEANLIMFWCSARFQLYCIEVFHLNGFRLKLNKTVVCKLVNINVSELCFQNNSCAPSNLNNIITLQSKTSMPSLGDKSADKSLIDPTSDCHYEITFKLSNNCNRFISVIAYYAVGKLIMHTSCYFCRTSCHFPVCDCWHWTRFLGFSWSVKHSYDMSGNSGVHKYSWGLFEIRWHCSEVLHHFALLWNL